MFPPEKPQTSESTRPALPCSATSSHPHELDFDATLFANVREIVGRGVMMLRGQLRLARACLVEPRFAVTFCVDFAIHLAAYV